MSARWTQLSSDDAHRGEYTISRENNEDERRTHFARKLLSDLGKRRRQPYTRTKSERRTTRQDQDTLPFQQKVRRIFVSNLHTRMITQWRTEKIQHTLAEPPTTLYALSYSDFQTSNRPCTPFSDLVKQEKTK